MKEVWKDIDGFEGIYQVSNFGRVKSIDRIVFDKNNHTRHIKECFMSGSNNGHGYLTVMLSINGKGVRKYIHRLVAQAFIPNPKNLPEVNHKDENRSNNIVTNLEWVDYLTNRTYGTRLKRLSDSNTIHSSIIQYDLDFNYIAEYKSIRQASKILKVNDADIYKCANKNLNTAHGYIWRYKDDTDIYNIPKPSRLFKDIYQYNATTGEFINHYYTYQTASKKMNITPTIIRKYIDSDTVIHNYFWSSTPLDKNEISEKINIIQNLPVKGVIKYGNKWYSKITYNKEIIKLGSYNNEIDAIKARLKKEIELFGVLNSPQNYLFMKYLNIDIVSKGTN